MRGGIPQTQPTLKNDGVTGDARGDEPVNEGGRRDTALKQERDQAIAALLLLRASDTSLKFQPL